MATVAANVTAPGALRSAARASNRVWIGYLLFLFCLLIAASRVSSLDLFLDTPFKLPFLGVPLPLRTFFCLGPVAFLVVHACVLVHFANLARKVREFDVALQAQLPDPKARDQCRQQLPNDIFVQFLAGPPTVRDGVFGLIFWLFASLSLVIAPLALLLLFQLQFLAYHDTGITWLQRIVIVVDLALLWRFWPGLGFPQGEVTDRGWPRHRGLVEGIQLVGSVLGMLPLTVGVVLIAYVIATIPGEWLERQWGSIPQIVSLRKVLVAGELDDNTHKSTGVWSDRLVLPGLKSDVPFALSGRHLEGAVLIGAKLGGADFSGALLANAVLRSADLRGALLEGAQLQGAILDHAQLQGASLIGTRLEGAYLRDAALQGAYLDDARLAGAVLGDAHLQGASLRRAQLEGAYLDKAQLQGAFLDGAQLQSASMYQTRLDGAVLDGAQLQGAQLGGANLSAALLRKAFVWRVDARTADATDARIDSVEIGPKSRVSSTEIIDWSAASFATLKQRITSDSPQNAFVAAALTRLDRLNPVVSLAGEKPMAKKWTELESLSPAPAPYEAKLANSWRQTGCAADGAPYVLAGIIRTLTSDRTPFPRESSQAASLAADFLKDECLGANGLSDELRENLKALRDRMSRPG